MGPLADGLEIRAASADDLPACERIWRDGLNDYLGRLGQPGIPEDNPALRRLHAHTLATDGSRFRVATRGDRVVAFGSAVQRGPVWFLSMLFVDPAEQARGLGRRLLAELRPVGRDGILATATDSAQPISNGLYSSLGIVPRMPLLNAVGRPVAGWAPPPLPGDIEIGALATDGPAADGTVGLSGKVLAELAGLDREVLGFEHPADHAFALRERPSAFAYRDRHGSLVGYGYTSPVGRIGPVAVRDATLLAPVIGHLLSAVEPRGASAIWLAGAAAPAIGLALSAGLRFEDFPILVCWNRPFADFERYVPISPGLL
jgi:GNAT superfamily N-acetyltransferase